MIIVHMSAFCLSQNVDKQISSESLQNFNQQFVLLNLVYLIFAIKNSSFCHSVGTHSSIVNYPCYFCSNYKFLLFV